MIIVNFETGETGTIFTAFDLHKILVHEILELDMKDKALEEFREKVEVTFKSNGVGIPFDSLEGIRYTFATVGSQFLGLTVEECDKVYEKFLEVVKHEENVKGVPTIENIDNCVNYEMVRKACRWRFVDCKQITSVERLQK